MRGQTGTAPLSVTLPGRRFFDPLAAALIEMRRDLLWNRANAPRATAILKAVTHMPEGLYPQRTRLSAPARADAEAGHGAATLTPEARDAMAEELWDIALLVEEGDLHRRSTACSRAQDRLDEAIRNGAEPDEIDRADGRHARGAERIHARAGRTGAARPRTSSRRRRQSMQMSADQLQQMLDELQQLMEEGRMAEAQELMEQLRQFMENMQVTQGQPGQGGGQGQQAMGDLQDTLRDSRSCRTTASRTCRSQQASRAKGSRVRVNRATGPATGSGSAAGPAGWQQPARDRARQPRRPPADLRDRLDGLQQGQLPGDGTEEGEAGPPAAGRCRNAPWTMPNGHCATAT